ncbi:unnamed protein product [Lampetra planeri]
MRGAGEEDAEKAEAEEEWWGGGGGGGTPPTAPPLLGVAVERLALAMQGAGRDAARERLLAKSPERLAWLRALIGAVASPDTSGCVVKLEANGPWAGPTLALQRREAVSQSAPRLASNATFVLGTVAEGVRGSELVLRVARECDAERRLRGGGGDDGGGLLQHLSAMLGWQQQHDAVTNAAGTLGTLAESVAGREWLLSEGCVDTVIEQVTVLLGGQAGWAASNAALVLARISISEAGCQRLLAHRDAAATLQRLVQSLSVDSTGCGMNAAFALGRLCDLPAGRDRLLGLGQADSMISALSAMVCHGDLGSGKNACFALSCLASDATGHDRLCRHRGFPATLDRLAALLEAEEPEAAWFAATLLRTLASQPAGVVSLRAHPTLQPTLQRVTASEGAAGPELLEEASVTLRKLQPLPRPPAPRVEVLGPHAVRASWEALQPESGVRVTYRLFDRGEVAYTGPDTSCVLSGLEPHTALSLSLQALSPGDDGPLSAPATALTDDGPPGPPDDPRLTACGPTHARLSWRPPRRPAGAVRSYVVLRGDAVVATTSELGCLVGGLRPGGAVELAVCAVTGAGRGERAVAAATMPGVREHAPRRLALAAVGRTEISISWEPPSAPLGRFFNYELRVNGRVVYLGTARGFVVRRLAPGCEYAFVVSAVTSEGKFESKAATRCIPGDEQEGAASRNAAVQHQPAETSGRAAREAANSSGGSSGGDESRGEKPRRSKTLPLPPRTVPHGGVEAVHTKSPCGLADKETPTLALVHRKRSAKSVPCSPQQPCEAPALATQVHARSPRDAETPRDSHDGKAREGNERRGQGAADGGERGEPKEGKGEAAEPRWRRSERGGAATKLAARPSRKVALNLASVLDYGSLRRSPLVHCSSSDASDVGRSPDGVWREDACRSLAKVTLLVERGGSAVENQRRRRAVAAKPPQQASKSPDGVWREDACRSLTKVTLLVERGGSAVENQRRRRAVAAKPLRQASNKATDTTQSLPIIGKSQSLLPSAPGTRPCRDSGGLGLHVYDWKSLLMLGSRFADRRAAGKGDRTTLLPGLWVPELSNVAGGEPSALRYPSARQSARTHALGRETSL